METQTLVKEICTTSTKEALKNGALLVDVREKDEVDQLSYDVPNIMHIPLSEFEERYTEVPKDINVVMVCKDGTRSLRGAGFLVNHGFENVANMKRGIIRWVEKEFPTKGDIKAVSNDGCCSSTGCC